MAKLKYDRTGIEAELRRGHSILRAYASAEASRQASGGIENQRKDVKKVFELFKMDFSSEQIVSAININHESIYRKIYAEIRA